MNNKSPEKRLEVVQHYLNTQDSLRKTAEKFEVSYRAVFKWVKLYKKYGKEKLLATYKKPWNRAENEVEEKIALLKELNPALTIRKAKKILSQKGIRVSKKGILGIWKRYGYAGFDKGNMTYDISEYAPWTKETTERFSQAHALYKLGNTQKSAEILNTIPLLPQNDLLNQIPDSLLNLRRRVDKMIYLFGETSLSSYIKKAHSVYETCKKENLNNLALRIGVFEVLALGWAVKPMRMLQRIKELQQIYTQSYGCSSYSLFGIRFPLLVSEGTAYGMLGKIKKASEIAYNVRELLSRQNVKPPLFMLGLANMYTFLENKNEAEYWYRECLKKIGESDEKYEWLRKTAKNYLADVFASKGEYKKAIEILKGAELPGWRYRPRNLFYQSMWYLHQAMPYKAISLSSQALSFLKKKDIRGNIFNVNFTMASSYASLGETKKAEQILKRVIPYLVKVKLKKRRDLLNVLTGQRTTGKNFYKPYENILPTVKLALLLKHGFYIKAMKYSKKNGLQSNFYKYIFFYPQLILNLLDQGKPTYLPKKILRLPVFNKEIPVYSVKFLGNVIIHKNQKYLRTKLTPKDCAFCIHVALSISEPHKKIPLDMLYKNFWPRSAHPARNLSHLLMRIKKELRIPPHLLMVSYKKDEQAVVNKGMYFTTDYSEFNEAVIQAHAFLRAGEWFFAKKEFKRGFNLVRAEPFIKMYDQWSEDTRNIILNKFENEVVHFSEACIKYHDYRTAKKILNKVSKIVSHLKQIDEIKKRIASERFCR